MTNDQKSMTNDQLPITNYQTNTKYKYQTKAMQNAVAHGGNTGELIITNNQ